MDLTHDTVADGRALRVLTVLDLYRRDFAAFYAGPGRGPGVFLTPVGPFPLLRSGFPAQIVNAITRHICTDGSLP
jgi:hypothetical protein